jgi:DNA-directed RNA polymerase subunit RPC12/RpoP
MAKRDQRLYQCEECKHKQYVHWVELNRRTRPRCVACGSVRLAPYSEGAKDDRRIGDLNVRDHDDSRGDVVRANQ